MQKQGFESEQAGVKKQPLLWLFFADGRSFINEPNAYTAVGEFRKRVTEARLANFCELTKQEREKSRPLKTSPRRSLKRRQQQKKPCKKQGFELERAGVKKQPLLWLFFADGRSFINEPNAYTAVGEFRKRVTEARLANFCELN